MAFEIDGAVALITGGNTGIGKETAIALARQGARVVFTSRDETRGGVALAEIRERSGRDDVEMIGLDLASLDSVRRCAEAFTKGFDRLDLLVVFVEPRGTRSGVDLEGVIGQGDHTAGDAAERLTEIERERTYFLWVFSCIDAEGLRLRTGNEQAQGQDDGQSFRSIRTHVRSSFTSFLRRC